MVLKLQNSMNNVKRNKKSEMFSRNEIDMRAGKIRIIRENPRFRRYPEYKESGDSLEKAI